MLVLSKGAEASQIVQRLILTVLSIDEDLAASNAEQLCEAFDAYFGVHLSVNQLNDAISELLDRDYLAREPNGRLAVADPSRRQVLADIAASQEVERGVRREWDEMHRVLTEDVRNTAWKGLHAFLARAFLRHGAETTQLLAPDLSTSERLRQSFEQMLADTLREHRDRIAESVLEDAIYGFFKEPTPLRTKYLSELMDASFTLFALSVDQVTARFLSGNLRRLDLFADTNFLFALLGLNQPSDVVSAAELTAMVQQLKVPFNFYYYPETMVELQTTIQAIGGQLRSQRWSRAASEAAWRSGRFSDLALKYFEQNSRRQTDPDAFLMRYRRADAIVRQFGLKPFKAEIENAEDTARRQEMTGAYDEYLKSRTPPRVKPYSAIDHDMRVRLLVAKRRTVATNIFDAGSFMLTMDHVLYRYDWTRLRRNGEIGVTVMPHQLVQLLRPFAHGVPDYDRRFVEGFSLPEIRSIRSFNPNVSTKVLTYLNTVSDLQPRTAAAILSDEILAQAVSGLDPRSPEFGVQVENALARQNAELQDELESTRREVVEAESDRTKAQLAHEAELEALQKGLLQTESALTELEQTRNEELNRYASAKQALQDEKARIEKQLTEGAAAIESAQNAARRVATRYRLTIASLVWLLALILLLAVPLALGHAEWFSTRYVQFLVGLVGLLAGLLAAWVYPKHRKASIGFALGVPGLVLIEAIGAATIPLPWHI